MSKSKPLKTNPTEALNAGISAFAENLTEGAELVAGFFFVHDGEGIKMVHAVRNHDDAEQDLAAKDRIHQALDEFLRDKRREWFGDKVAIEA